jgi:diaminopimelate epimerase
MQIRFSKYHGAGNDFVMIDDRDGQFPYGTNVEVIKTLCDRHFGIGADGLILIKPSLIADFKMDYYNADGNIGSMCGNGSRCAVIFASAIELNFTGNKLEAYDGAHSFELLGDNRVRVSMADVKDIYMSGDSFLMNTGSPHLVVPVTNLDEMDVFHEGRAIRYSDEFAKEGVNVNFITAHGGVVYLRTYERGVEDETLACGTGCVAAAIACSVIIKNESTAKQEYAVKAKGGDLKVTFLRQPGSGYTNVTLEGPVEKVFDGTIEL